MHFFQCLFYNEIPFAEDLRQLSFGSLPVTEDVPSASKKSTPSGKYHNSLTCWKAACYDISWEFVFIL